MNLDNPKLTAYALGELTGDERAAVEAALKNDPKAQRFVEETAAFGDLLKQSLAEEAAVTLKEDEREAVLAKAKTVRFPLRKVAGVAGLSTLAAALALLPFVPMLIESKPVNHGIASAPASVPSEAPTFDVAAPLTSGQEIPVPPVAPEFSKFLATGKGEVGNSILSSSHVVASETKAKLDRLAPSPRSTPPSATIAAPPPPGALTAAQARQISEFTRGWAKEDSRREQLADTRRARRSEPMLGMTPDQTRSDLDGQLRKAKEIERKHPSGPSLSEESRSNESYSAIIENGFTTVAQAPLSTFSIDVDTASYSNIRRLLTSGQQPPADAVRIEELINYFAYDYPQPKGDAPFSTTLEVAECPWTPEHRLVRIGLKGRSVPASKRPAANLVFLIDVSGSMVSADKLPLLKESLRLLVDQLGPKDRVAIVVYAGAAGLVLPPTGVDEKGAILKALDSLNAGGSTNGGQGIQLAYQTAGEMKAPGSINRVILASDGDFNVGMTSHEELTRLIEEKAKSNIFLTVLGFGTGNLKDATMEKLANRGNGNYAYIDSLREGRKVLVEQMSGTLQTIAKDVKIQVEFNPAVVGSYRLIGYENRLLAKEDFNDDKKDAGEIGAGHTVTALYEVVPAALGEPGVDPLKYQKAPTPQKTSDEMLTLKLRFKEPEGDKSRLIEEPLKDAGRNWAQSSRDFRFAAAVAEFGMLLRGSSHAGSANWESVKELAIEGKGADEGGYREEFLKLVEKASLLR